VDISISNLFTLIALTNMFH